MNKLSAVIEFKPLKTADLPSLYQWFQEPLIKQYYAKNQSWSLDDIKNKYLPRIQGLDEVPSFIIHVNHNPAGFIQYYGLNNHLPEGVSKYTNLLFDNYRPEDLAGIDMFIADAHNRGKGLGSLIINKFIETQLMFYQAIVVDPEIHNLQAIKCYEKAGFKSTSYSEISNSLLLMKLLKK
jgi:aminoglycoside 6'-N-acetyltransferase